MCLRHISVAGPPYVRLPLTCQIALEHCQCHIGVANYGNMWHGSKSLVSHSIVVVMWHSTAELTPLRSMFFRKVVEGKEDAIWKVKSDFRHLSIRKHFTFNLVFHFFELR